MKPIAVLGAGSWGTTLAQILALQGLEVRLWARSPSLCDSMKDTLENALYLPGVNLSGNIRPTASFEEALSGAGIIVSAIPSHGVRKVFAEAVPFISGGAVVVS
ncbi:MAG: NAD(P)-binding domain-containing protein, partial [Deltaproteobacteria bacterium]|nr:NAD(P)-binding domain-containing protein [Deltaproteobacteria bacterium]